MKLVKKILNKLNGLHYRQEYLCFAKESFQQPLHVYLVHKDQVVKDITNGHLFVGYCPLVFALPGTDLPETIRVIFSQRLLHPNAPFLKKDALASLDLKMIKKQAVYSSSALPTGLQNSVSRQVFYYEGTRGKHLFLSAFHQLINRIHNNLYNKKPGNVFLKGDLYEQVQIAYAIPRNISLISISHAGLFNLFPTDLHGQAGEQHYIISLRIGGKACRQVETAGKLLISEVYCNMYKTVYALGKNHMQPLKQKDNFPFSQTSSAIFQLPMPEHCVACRELILLDSFNHGIHKIFLFKILFSKQTGAEKATLAHIHNSYASWRYKNGLPGNYLLR